MKENPYKESERTVPLTPYRRIGDRMTTYEAMVIVELSEAERRYDAQLERKTKIRDRMSTGTIVINAASATALFSAIQSGQDGLRSLAIPADASTQSLLMFVGGVVVGAFAFWAESIIAPRWAADQFNRLQLMRRRNAWLQASDSEENMQQLRKIDAELQEAPQQDFRVSWIHNALISLSGSLWVGGVYSAVAPVIRALVAS